MDEIGDPLLNVRLTMRRALLLLAVVMAGFGGGGYDDPITAVGAPHEITSYTAVTSSAAVIRATQTVVLPAPESNAGPGPRPALRRGDGQALAFIAPLHLAGRAASFGARRAEYCQYAAPHAAARAGLLSSPTTAPPPFPLV